jgi:hypothetical protein
MDQTYVYLLVQMESFSSSNMCGGGMIPLPIDSIHFGEALYLNRICLNCSSTNHPLHLKIEREREREINDVVFI